MHEDDKAPTGDAAPGRTLLTTRSGYVKAADRLLELVRRELRIFDPDLIEFRLEAPARIAALKQFLSANRDNRLWIAVHDPEYVKSHCPRLIALLGTYTASMAIHGTTGEAAKAQDCFVLADRVHVVRRPVAVQSRGVFIINDQREGLAMRERFEEIWDCSEASVSANTTGL